MQKHLNIKISGQVQGVGFRFSAEKLAHRLGLFGLAQNQLDGSVYIEVEGEEKQIDKFLRWCKKGPQFAQIDDVIISEDEIKNFSHFTIQF